jgi:hypothetical protein
MDNKKFTNNEERENYLEEKFHEERQKQEENLLVDFDKAIEEEQNKNKPYKIKFLGKIYYVPYQMPFDFSLFFFRYCYKKINGKIVVSVPDDKLDKFIILMIGHEVVRALENTKYRPSLDFVFKELAAPILSKWGYDVNSNNNTENNIEKKI